MSIRAVYFDLGGVLVRTEDRTPRTQLAQSVGLGYRGLEAVVFGSETASQASVGAISEEAHWQSVLQSLHLPESEKERVYETFFGGDVIDRPLLDFVNALRPRLKTGLISNAWDGLRAWACSEGIDNAFDSLTISAEVGFAKPDPQIYEYALQALGVRPEETIFFDDMPANIQGANALGMHGFVFHGSEEAIAEIHNWID